MKIYLTSLMSVSKNQHGVKHRKRAVLACNSLKLRQLSRFWGAKGTPCSQDRSHVRGCPRSNRRRRETLLVCHECHLRSRAQSQGVPWEKLGRVFRTHEIQRSRAQRKHEKTIPCPGSKQPAVRTQPKESHPSHQELSQLSAVSHPSRRSWAQYPHRRPRQRYAAVHNPLRTAHW